MEYDRDADVARAAGGENAIHPTPKHCRDFLESVRVICHRVVMSKEIKEEWDEHKSNFTRTWLYKMFHVYSVKSIIALCTAKIQVRSTKDLSYYVIAAIVPPKTSVESHQCFVNIKFKYLSDNP